jgi:glycerol-3-phosphate dehydrogenase
MVRCGCRYAGLRPGSDVSTDYLIDLNERDAPWLTVGGIRSTGLTASLGIAKHVARLADAAVHARADAADGTAAREMSTTPLPPVHELVQSFRERADGSVVFGSDAMGFGAHTVTHPLTRAGLERLAKSMG